MGFKVGDMVVCVENEYGIVTKNKTGVVSEVGYGKIVKVEFDEMIKEKCFLGIGSKEFSKYVWVRAENLRLIDIVSTEYKIGDKVVFNNDLYWESSMNGKTGEVIEFIKNKSIDGKTIIHYKVKLDIKDEECIIVTTGKDLTLVEGRKEKGLTDIEKVEKLEQENRCKLYIEALKIIKEACEAYSDDCLHCPFRNGNGECITKNYPSEWVIRDEPITITRVVES